SNTGNRQIQLAIAIEVAYGYFRWIGAHRSGLGRLEGAIAVAEQHREAVVLVVGNRQIELAIAIKIGRDDIPRKAAAGSNIHTSRSLEGSIAVTQQSINVPGPEIDHC